MKFCPDEYDFVFTIIDDTDDATYDNIRPVYDLLLEYGVLTTKTVWPISCPEGSRKFFAAETLQENSQYLSYLIFLQNHGFEIASHGATMESSLRERTLRGLQFLSSHFGKISLHCNHGQNRENLYWGHKRFNSPPFRAGFRFYESLKGRQKWEGDEPDSAYYWGDLALEHFSYFRSFTFCQPNLRKITDNIIYRIRDTPWVRNWFITSDAPDIAAFRKLLNRRSLDQLENENGVCILSTHLGKGFSRKGVVDPHFREIVRDLSERRGWYVPAGRLFDYCTQAKEPPLLRQHQVLSLEAQFILQRLRCRL